MKIKIKKTMANGEIVFADGSFVAKILDTKDGKEFSKQLLSVNEKVNGESTSQAEALNLADVSKCEGLQGRDLLIAFQEFYLGHKVSDQFKKSIDYWIRHKRN